MFRRGFLVPRGPETSTNRLQWVYMVNTKSQHAQYSSHWTCMASTLRHIFEFERFPIDLRCFTVIHSQSHIGANSLPKAPMKLKNTFQRSYICVETLLFTPNVLGICLEQMLTHVWHLRKQYKTKTNTNVVLFVFL